MAHSLDPKGDERNANHQQVQDVEVVPAEGAFVEESPISSHLWAITRRHKETLPLASAQETSLRASGGRGDHTTWYCSAEQL